MDHRLFVPGQIVGKLNILLESLAQPGDVPMAENPEASLNELIFLRIALRILIPQESNDRLRHRHPANHQGLLPSLRIFLGTLARAEVSNQSLNQNALALSAYTHPTVSPRRFRNGSL